MPLYEQGELDAIAVTFASGASLSAAVDLGGRGIARIISDSAWTAAALTMQVSNDGATYVDRYDSTGAEWSGPTLPTAASRSFDLDIAANAAFHFVKFRSGTGGAPVNQGAARTLTLIVKAF